MLKVLLTGGLGYIGQEFCRVWTNTCWPDDFSLTVVDNNMFSCNIDKFHKSFPKVELRIQDVREIIPSIKNYDIVIHLAALVGAPLCNRYSSSYVREINADVVGSIARNMSSSQRLIYPNTNSGYGTTNEICREDSPINPLSTYASTKHHGEYHALNHKNSLVFRLATVFGVSPRTRTDLLVNSLTLEAIKTNRIELFEGVAKRNYVHVNDVVRIIKHGIYSLGKQEVYNLGNDECNMTKLELAQLIQKQTNCEIVQVNKQDPDKRNYFVSSAKLEMTGMKPSISLYKGIEEIIKAYRQTPEVFSSNV